MSLPGLVVALLDGNVNRASMLMTQLSMQM